MKLPVESVADIGAAIRAVRKNSRIRIDDFALTAHVSKQFMTDVENGKATVQMGRVLGVLKELGLALTVEVPDAAVPRLRRAQEAPGGRRTTATE